LNKLVLNKFIG